MTGDDPETPDAGAQVPEGLSRREALKRVGAGGLVLGTGFVAGGAIGSDAQEDTEGTYDGGRLSRELPVGVAAGPYGTEFSVPDDLEGDALDHLTFPPPPAAGPVELEMAVVEHPHRVSLAHTVSAWSYNGTSPGPIIRANEGQTIRIHFSNKTGHDHNLHFHGRHSPLHDGWEPIPPGSSTIYEIEAGPAGLHPYHCHTMPIDRHIAKGLYGALIVDPPGGRPEAREVVLALSGWDVDDDGRNELYSWNGVAGFYQKYPIKLPVGEPVRAYVLNMTEFDPIASFHLHAQTFDVYPAGMGQVPAFSSDIVTLGQMERAMLEFSLPEVGRYMFHPHQHAMVMRGAMGWFAAI